MSTNTNKTTHIYIPASILEDLDKNNTVIGGESLEHDLVLNDAKGKVTIDSLTKEAKSTLNAIFLELDDTKISTRLVRKKLIELLPEPLHAQAYEKFKSLEKQTVAMQQQRADDIAEINSRTKDEPAEVITTNEEAKNTLIEECGTYEKRIYPVIGITDEDTRPISRIFITLLKQKKREDLFEHVIQMEILHSILIRKRLNPQEMEQYFTKVLDKSFVQKTIQTYIEDLKQRQLIHYTS